jgi:transcriptional regulator with XRE-family HTH domain
VNERIKKLRKVLDLTQTEFGRRIGVKQNTVALIEGGRKTSDQTIFAICREFNVSEEWLRTGEGEMFRTRSRDEEIAAFIGSITLRNDPGDEFKRRLIHVLARLSVEDWRLLEDLAARLAEEAEKEKDRPE